MNIRALLSEPLVLATVTSLLAGGPKAEPRVPLWLRRGAAAFGLMSVGAATLSGAIYVFRRYPAEEAALLFALYTALAAIFAFLASMAWNAYRAHRMIKLPKRAMEKLENTTGFALNELGALAGEYPKTAAILLALAGYLVVSKAAAGTEALLSALDTKINKLHERDTDHEQEDYDNRYRPAAGDPDHRRH